MPDQSATPAEPAAPANAGRRRKKDIPFTPKTHPGLSREDCDFLNTPLKDCDPEKLRVLLDALSHGIADVMGPGLGMDADALFSTFCGRLFLTPDATAGAAPDAPAEPPAEMPAAPEDAAPDAPPVPPSPPFAAGEGQAADTTATAAVPVQAIVPTSACLTGPALPQPRSDSRRSLHARRPLRRQHCSQLRSVTPAAPHRPPARRLCYARGPAIPIRAIENSPAGPVSLRGRARPAPPLPAPAKWG